MKRFLACLLVYSMAAVGLAQVPADPRAKVEALEKRIKQLEEQLQGKAQPVNLGRTSLASVSASSVNGSRALDNTFYGILNCFDDGANWQNNINYTYWLSGGEPSPWAQVDFDVPVVVTQIVVEGATAAYSARLEMAKGGEVILEQPPDGGMKPAEPIAGVKGVRVTFAAGQQNLRVHEIRIMGYVPDGTQYKAGLPRILMTERNAEAIALEAYQNWSSSIWHFTTPKLEDRDTHYLITYRRGELPVFRCTIDKRTGKVTTEELVELAPKAPTTAPAR